MKTMLNALTALCLMLFSLSFTSGQKGLSKTIEFKVAGNCGMCKKTIEGSLKGKAGITTAVWNKDTKRMKVEFDPSKITEEQIHQNIADSGHDTEKKKASNKTYNDLPGCCQYERL